MFVTISKNNKTYVTQDFQYNEFYTTSSVPSGFEHEIDYKLIIAAQVLRTFTGCPWHITSSFRTPSHQGELVKLREGSNVSQHLLGRAIDLQPVYEKDREFWIPIIQDELLKKGDLWNELRLSGINGFGFYNTFLHLDTRQERMKQNDHLGSYGFWDYRTLDQDLKKKAS